MWYNEKYIGDSPSGKAVGSGPTIRGFESLISSQVEILDKSTMRKCSGFMFIAFTCALIGY